MKEIRSAALYGQHMIGIGATAAVTHGNSYVLSQAWAKAIHDHPQRLDGIVYTCRHDDSAYALALFERATSKLQAGAIHRLSGRDLRTLRLLERYGLGLEM